MSRRIRLSTLGRVSRNALVLLSGQVGARVLNLVLIAHLGRELGAGGLGRYLLAISLEALVLAVADLGVGIYTTREFAGDMPEDDERALWGTVLGLKLLAALASALVLNAFIGPLVFGADRRVLVAIVSLALPPDALSSLATAFFRARQRMEVSSSINLGMRIVAALSGVLLVRSGYNESAVLLSYAMASLLGCAAFAVLLHIWNVRPRWASFPRRWRAVLRETTPFAITGVAALLYTRADLLLLSFWQGDAPAGLYGAAYRLKEALGMIPASFLDALFPELSRVGRRQLHIERLQLLYRRGQLVTAAVVGVLMVPCLIAARHIVGLLFDQAADATVSTALFRGLLLTFPLTYFYLLNGHALYAVGQQGQVTRAMVVATLLNVLLNVIAVPLWSYWGAVGAAVVSEIVILAWLQAVIRRSLLVRTATLSGDCRRICNR